LQAISFRLDDLDIENNEEVEGEAWLLMAWSYPILL
jgi:hypothetical protein